MGEGWTDWELLEPLSSGASGVVYRACRKGYPEYQSAVKVINIPPDKEETEELRQTGMTDEQIQSLYQWRTDRTVAGIQRMEHFKGMSNLVSIEDFRIEPAEDGYGSRVYVRMEYLKPLPAYLADKRMEEEETIRMGVDLCKALEILHDSGVIHQDIKPDNIFVNDRLPYGQVFKLGDLDMMRALSDSAGREEIRGTPSYMAPEIPAGQTPDVRTDLYELGLTLYQIANENRLPFLPKRQFSSHHDLEIATQMRFSGTELPAPEGVSIAFFSILQKACAFRPEQRFVSATEMRKALEVLLKEPKSPWISEKESDPGRSIQSNKKAKKAKWRKHIIIAVFMLLIAGIILSGIQGNWIHKDHEAEGGTSVPENGLNSILEDPVGSRIHAVYRQAQAKRVLPDERGCCIPINLDVVPALAELDEYLKLRCRNEPPDEINLAKIPIEGKVAYSWRNDTELQSLEVSYSSEAGEMTAWELVLLLEDRANGWNVNRDSDGGKWHLRWNPPLRATIVAEYSADGKLIRVIRGNRSFETREELPEITGVEFLQ